MKYANSHRLVSMQTHHGGLSNGCQFYFRLVFRGLSDYLKMCYDVIWKNTL